MLLLAVSGADKLGIGDAAISAVLGYAVVFFGIICLMVVTMIMGKIFVAKANKANAAKAAQKASAPAPAPTPKKLAPGSAGELMLHDVEPRDAAMIMAIVADKLQKPLNELRFKSIKEVK